MTRGRVPPRCPGPVMTIVSPAGASPHRQLKPGNRPPSPQAPHIVHPGQRDERCRRRLRERAGQRLSTAGAAGRCAVRTSAPRVPFLVASAGWLTVLTGKIPCCLGRRPAPPVRLRLPLVLVTPFPAAGSTRHRGPSAAGRSRRGPRPLPVQLPGDRRERCCVTVRLGAGQFRCQGEHRLLRQHRALLHLSRPRRRGGAAARFSPDGPGGALPGRVAAADGCVAGSGRRTRRGTWRDRLPPPGVQAAGEPWPSAGCLEGRVVSWGPDLLVPRLAGPAVVVGKDSAWHLPTRDVMRVSAAHLASLPATSPAEGCCGPAAGAARAMPLPAA